MARRLLPALVSVVGSVGVVGLSSVAVGCSAPDTAGTPIEVVTYDAALHDELVDMAARDQEQRTGGAVDETDEARTARLGQIVDDVGWPTVSLVGDDGEDAAWLIAQHSDLDLAFQKRALALLRGAVAADDASPGNLAYLEDRVAVAEGRPQTYATQVACGPGGPAPRTPIRDRAHVDERRSAAGIEPLSDYLDEMTTVCAADQ